MKVNAVITHSEGTLVTPIPYETYAFYEKLYSVGIPVAPSRIHLSPRNEKAPQLSLYADDEVGKHFIRIPTSNDTLESINIGAYLVENASQDYREKLVSRILKDRYNSIQELIHDTKLLIYESGPVKQSFYFPLCGSLDEDGTDPYPVDNSFLRAYKWAIQEEIQNDTLLQQHDMADFFHGDDRLGEKLTSAVWSVVGYHQQLFGKVECSLKEPMTEKEMQIMKDWICGQNSDGFGEGFEQNPIRTEDGDLYVSFWNTDDDYAVMTRDELDDYIANQGMGMYQ